jgi:hypothetical protein
MSNISASINLLISTVVDNRCAYGKVRMQKQARTVKILVSLVASMSLGALVLMALDNHRLTGGPFSLASYRSLDPVENLTSSFTTPNTHNWQQIQVHYSPAPAENLEQLAAVSGLSSQKELNFHFTVLGGIECSDGDGEIQATQRWLKQRPALQDKSFFGTSQTIRICVITDGIRSLPSDCQVKRTAAIIESLARKFTIATDSINYPKNWQL